MQGYERIIEQVVQGCVLDDNGAWVPIADKTAAEREFRSHLEKGEVLKDERWVSLHDARE
jgi:hypothetical protein